MASTTEVQEIWFKSKRVIRTLVQTGIPAFLSFAVVLPQIIKALGLPVESDLYVWLIAVAAGVTAVATGLAAVMAIPAVNAFLVSFGLGSVPKSETTIPGDHDATVLAPEPQTDKPL